MYCRLGQKTYYHNPKDVLQRLKMIDLAGVLQRLYIWSSMFVLGKCSVTSKMFYWVIRRTLFKWSLNVNLESRMVLMCFWETVWITVLLLKIRGEWYTSFVFLLQITSWSCLRESGSRLIFYWKTQFLITLKSSFNSVFEATCCHELE